MTRTSDLSTPARAYIAGVVAAGMVAILASAYTIANRPLESGWLILSALTLLTGSFSIKLPGINARISVSEAFVFAAVMLFGTAAATLVVALDTLVLTNWKHATPRSRVRALFNMAAGAAAIWTAATLYFAILPTGSAASLTLQSLLFPIVTLAATYFLVNSSLVAVAVGFESGRSALGVWRDNFAWLSLNYLGGASVASLLVTYTQNVDLTTLSVIVPLLVITYLTFRTSLGRLDDARRHLGQLNDLYFSTIEALAMAVDAKDQITHGHIRRVQHYAIALARKLGVDDTLQLKAIEAAALLHDMGKLAIPEHILNKPGKLTHAEFETMKTHASIGAELLSSIPFPYPVVPIVRHHHEQWNGHGYPDGVAGTDIPIGARILSVVDCFDALNSERPYRSKLTVEESFRILLERRGSMYDPLVVDTFINSFAEISAGLTSTDDTPSTSDGKAGVASEARTSPEWPLDRGCVSVRTDDSELARLFAGFARGLQELTPATTCALFRYSEQSDSIECSHACGDGAHALVGTIRDRGDGVIGWVAATKRQAVNSDPSLELKGRIDAFRVRPRSLLAIPLSESDRLLGVVALYADCENAFSVRDVRGIEEVCRGLVAVLSRSEIGHQVPTPAGTHR